MPFGLHLDTFLDLALMSGIDPEGVPVELWGLLIFYHLFFGAHLDTSKSLVLQ
jgi:hypothetical protein